MLHLMGRARLVYCENRVFLFGLVENAIVLARRIEKPRPAGLWRKDEAFLRVIYIDPEVDLCRAALEEFLR